MGLLDWFFGGKPGTRAPANPPADTQTGMKVVALADRVPERSFSTPVIGVTEDNHDGRNRQQEIAQSAAGDEVVLAFEPRRRPQPNMVAVWSTRTGGQLGYLPVETAAYIALNAKRHDFRSLIAEIRGDEGEDLELDLTIEVYAKRG